MHGRDAVFTCLTRAFENDVLAVDVHRPRVRLVDPGKHLDQSRLSSAVVTQQAEHFAGMNLERDVVENVDRTKGLADVGQSQ